MPRSSIRGPDLVTVTNGGQFVRFLAVEFRRQLTLRSNVNKRKAKSNLSVCNRFWNCFKRIASVFYLPVTYVYNVIIDILLILGGIEQNPGPAPQAGSSGPSILSQNWRGVTDRKKLLRILKKIYPSRQSSGKVIACLQETHCIDQFSIDNCFNGQAIVDNGQRNQKGVCILVPDSYEVCSSTVSGIGRWAIGVVKSKDPSKDMKYVTSTVYAPNCHREALVFFQEFFRSLDEVTEDLISQNMVYSIIITGDFNVVLDHQNGASNRLTTVAERTLSAHVMDAMESRGLIETKQLTQGSNFTWRRGACLSKLDYIFLNRPLADKVTEAETKWHYLGAKFDHAAVSVKTSDSPDSARGRSFPKLYSSDIKKESDKVWLLEQLVYYESQIPNHWSSHMKLDFLKSMLRSKTLELRQMNKFTDNLAATKVEIESIISRAPLALNEAARLDALRLKLEELEEAEAEVNSIKAGVVWREQGEKSTAYFLARFKARTEGAAMHSLNVGTRIITGSANILSIVQQFYK